jgi:hypothetical protein
LLIERDNFNKSNMKTLLQLSLASASLLAAAQIQAQTTITDWTFENYTTASGTQVASPAPAVGSGTATALGMNNTYPTPGPSMALTDVILGSTASSTGTNNEWRVRGTEITGGTLAANGWSSAAPIGTQGAEFAVSTANFKSIQLTFDLETTTQGEKNLAVFYTLNDTASTPTWIDATISSVATAGATIMNNTGTDANTVTGSFLSMSTTAGFNNGITVNLSSVSGANNDPNFAVEIVNASTGADTVNLAGAALNNSSGNWRYDNVDFTGTSTAVPEPSDLALTGIGLTVLAGLRWKRRRKN